MKRGGEGAAVKIVNNYVVPDDFGHRKRALVQIAPKQPKKNQLNPVFSWFASFYPQLPDTETDGIIRIFLDGE